MMRARDRELMGRLEASGEMAARRRELGRWFAANPDAPYWRAVEALGYPDYMLGVADAVLMDMAAVKRRRGNETYRRAAAVRARRYLAWLAGKPRRRQRRGSGSLIHVSSLMRPAGCRPRTWPGRPPRVSEVARAIGERVSERATAGQPAGARAVLASPGRLGTPAAPVNCEAP